MSHELLAGCAINACSQAATHIGPTGLTDPVSPEGSMTLSCVDHADADAVPLAQARVYLVPPPTSSCDHRHVDKGDEFSPDRCRTCYQAIWPGGPR